MSGDKIFALSLLFGIILIIIGFLTYPIYLKRFYKKFFNELYSPKEIEIYIKRLKEHSLSNYAQEYAYKDIIEYREKQSREEIIKDLEMKKIAMSEIYDKK